MADETFELFSITNKLTLDTSQFDRAYGSSVGKMKTLAGETNKLEQSMKSGAGGTNTFSSSLSGLLPNLSALGGPAGAIGIVTAGIGMYAAAITGAAALTWELTKRFSDIGSELQDMADQVNFSTETLGTFQGVGKSVGVEVKELSAGLVTFQKNLLSGNDALKALGVTSTNNEEALRQTFKALSQVTDATMQSALAAEAFGTRGGKAMLAMIKATGGNLDEATDKLRKWNVLMSDQAVAIADEFGDKLAELGMRFQGIGNTIATETAPAFIAAFDQISAALDSSQIDWRWWGEQVGNIVVSSSAIIAGFIKAVQTMSAVDGPGAFIMTWKAGMDQAIEEMNAKRRELLAPMPEGMGGGRVPGRTIDWNPKGDKKDRATKDKEDPIIRLMERYQDQLRNLTPLTVEQQIREELLGKEYAKSSGEIKALLIVTGMAIDVKKKEIEAQRLATAEQERGEAAYKAFAQQQFETLRQLRDGTMSAFDEARVAMLDFLNVTTPVQRWWLEFDAILIDVERHLKDLPELMIKVAEAAGPPEIKFPETPESEIPDRAGEAANREMGLPPEMIESSLLKWKRLVDDFSHDITYTIDRAIHAGFEDGIKAGIIEFGLGILEMAKHEALNELQKAIARALGGGEEEGGGKKGGWLSTLVSFGVNAIAGMFGGGGGAGAAAANGPSGSGIGNFASGGFMYPNEWAMVGERGPELIKAGSRGASVMNNAETMGMFGGGLTVNQTIQVPSMYMAGNRQTQTQAMRGLTQAAQRGYSLRG
jgi:hypothetical protein